MNPSPDLLPALEELFTSHLLGESYDLNELARWCQEQWPKLPFAHEFREQLRTAIDKPGILDPRNYARWTDDNSYRTQEQLQDHLKGIWNACFPAEKLP